MLEYVKRLLLMQTKLAAQFDAGQTPEIRETALHAGAVQTEDALMDETAAKTQKMEASERAKSDQTQEQKVEDKLCELTRQTMRMESLQLQKTAQKEQEQTRRLEAAMTALQERQTVHLTKQTPNNAEGGLLGSYRQTMTVAGILWASRVTTSWPKNCLSLTPQLKSVIISFRNIPNWTI